MCDRGGIELLQSKNENGWRSLDWHQPHRISFSGRGPCVVTWLGTNSGIGTTYNKGEWWRWSDFCQSFLNSANILDTLPLLCCISTEQPCKKNRSGMGSYWGGGRTLSRHDSRKFWSIIINWIYSAFSLVPPPPLYLDDLKCFIYVLMIFFYQPCLGWDQVLSCKWTWRPKQKVSFWCMKWHKSFGILDFIKFIHLIKCVHFARR